MQNEKAKFLVRVLNNDRILVRDYSEVGFKTFQDMNQALNYLKSQTIKATIDDKELQEKS